MEKSEIIAKRDKLREILEEQKNSSKVGKIAYYEDFEVIKGDKNHNAFIEKDLFVVTRSVEQNGLKLEYYELYNDKNELIGRTNEIGELQYSKEFMEKLGPLSSHLDLEERNIYLNKEDEFTVQDKPQEELTEEDKELKKQKEEVYEKNKVENVEPALIEDDLGIDRNSISYCDEIKDKRFYDMVPESNDFSKTAMIIYSEKSNEFMVVGLKNGKFEKYNSIDSAKSVMKPVQNLNKDGRNIHSQAISGVLQYKHNKELDFSVNIEPTGDVKFQQLRTDLETGKVMSSDLETDAQYRPEWKVREMMNEVEKQDISNEVQKIEEKEERKNVNLDEIKEEEEDYQKVPWDRPRGRFR